MERIGFWIMFSGSILLLVSMCKGEKLVNWVEQKLHVPWYVQILTPVLWLLMVMIGWHVWCVGNKGRYPGYPLDMLIEWFR